MTLGEICMKILRKLIAAGLLFAGTAVAAPLPLPGPNGTVIPAVAERPCDYSRGLTMPVPTSANQTIEDGAKRLKTEAAKPPPRMGCLFKLSPQKMTDMIKNSHMGMKNGRAGIFMEPVAAQR